MKQLVIIGASGHGKVIADIAKKNEYEKILFLDDNESLIECGGYPVVGKSSQFVEYDCDMIVAIGNAMIRQRIQEQIEKAGKHIGTLLHPNAVIGENVTIGIGSVVMAGAVINPCATIGRGCIINTCASVDHDCVVEDYVHISVSSHLAGSVHIGSRTWIGIGAIISNNLDVTSDCIIGAGAVVVESIEELGTYIGVPAKKM
jgi:sugar O-acyltransferase (sialic acid O-acetyltransferase NeuD family)